MNEYSLCYREVIPDQTVPEQWKEFTLNTGGTQSILQDIKVPERANGYCYKDASKYYTRNRFIYWRISNDVLELVEQSLDVNLSGNRVRYRFTDTPVLDGITIHEYYGSVIILVPTVCSVHRLIFNHPYRIHEQHEMLGTHPDLKVPSIFADVSAISFSDPSSFHVVNNPHSTNSVLPHVAASFLNVGQEEAIFVFGYPNGELLLVRHSFSGIYLFTELKQDTIVPRFLSGIAVALRGKNHDGHVAVSIVLHSLDLEIYAICLGRDGNLRIWSCLKGQYVAVSDILIEAGDSDRNLVQGAQSHILRKSVDSNDADLTLAVFLSFASECQFHIFKPEVQNGIFKIIRIRTLYAAEQDLMDFSLDNKRIWTVWRGIDGECYVKCACLESQARSQWLPVILTSSFNPDCVCCDPGIDPRQAYVDFIFHPGKFPLNVITKALSIYKKTTALSDINLSAAVLKQRVCMAIEQEIQTQVSEFEVSDEDYLDIANRCWSKFYSCCVQYYAAGTKPLGLLQLPSVSGVVLLKKSMYSFLRPLDPLEQMMLCSEYTNVQQFQMMNHFQLSEDIDVCSDLIELMKVLYKLEQQLNEDFKYTIERELFQLRSPDKVMSELVIDLMAGSDTPLLPAQFLWNCNVTLSNCSDLYKAMHLLLEMLRMDTPKPDTGISKTMSTVNHLFSSEIGVSVTSETLHQMCVVRFSICRNLLLLQNILLERREMSWGILEAIRSVCMPDTVVFMQAYYAIVWLCEQPAIPVTISDESIQRLAILKLAPVFNLRAKNKQTMTILQLFAASTGGIHAHNNFAKMELTEDYLSHWHVSLLEYVNQLGQLVWAVSGNLVLGEWLLACGQHLLLQQYVRLLNPWCEWNICSRNFILASALLNSGEKYKAKDLFLKAAKGIFVETFLAERILLSEDESDAKALVNYHLKIIQLFEYYGARDCAIEVARTALSVAKGNDPHVATLHSVMFVHHLALSHYKEAYESLMANPDKERKEDNLRDLVKCLMDNKMLDLLMSFPYVDFIDTFTSIITTRARACDSVKNMYYDFLYSFEIKRGNMRQAATAMYEEAYRLGQHNTIDALEQQVKCYLATINCLYLVDEHNRWILRPVDQGEEEVTKTYPVEAGSEESPWEHKFVRAIKPLDLESIKKEFIVASARLRLARYNRKTLENQFTNPIELITMLKNLGIFKCALSLCQTFKTPYDGVFQTLTKMCVKLTRKENPKAWNWLVENDLADLQMVDSSPATVCWNLLESLLEEYEEPQMSVIHKIVASKLIELGAFIPQWLLISYKKRNAAELLRLYAKGGRLLEASMLAVEYIRAALGKGGEYFSIPYPLVPAAPAQCLPLNTICFILHELKRVQQEHKYEKEYTQLKYMYEKYVSTSRRVSNDMIRYGWAKVQG